MLTSRCHDFVSGFPGAFGAAGWSPDTLQPAPGHLGLSQSLSPCSGSLHTRHWDARPPGDFHRTKKLCRTFKTPTINNLKTHHSSQPTWKHHTTTESVLFPAVNPGSEAQRVAHILMSSSQRVTHSRVPAGKNILLGPLMYNFRTLCANLHVCAALIPPENTGTGSAWEGLSGERMSETAAGLPRGHEFCPVLWIACFQ